MIKLKIIQTILVLGALLSLSNSTYAVPKISRTGVAKSPVSYGTNGGQVSDLQKFQNMKPGLQTLITNGPKVDMSWPSDGTFGLL